VEKIDGVYFVEYAATNNQLVETNQIVQTVKNDLMEEISKLRIELETIKNSKGNAEIEELKTQLAGNCF
jgi:hypothetical protein